MVASVDKVRRHVDPGRIEGACGPPRQPGAAQGAVPFSAVAAVDEFDVHVLVDRAVAAQEADPLVRQAVLREIVELLVPGVLLIGHQQQLRIAPAQAVLAGAPVDDAQHHLRVIVGHIAAAVGTVGQRPHAEHFEAAARIGVGVDGIVA